MGKLTKPGLGERQTVELCSSGTCGVQQLPQYLFWLALKMYCHQKTDIVTSHSCSSSGAVVQSGEVFCFWLSLHPARITDPWRRMNATAVGVFRPLTD